MTDVWGGQRELIVQLQSDFYITEGFWIEIFLYIKEKLNLKYNKTQNCIASLLASLTNITPNIKRSLKVWSLSFFKTFTFVFHKLERHECKVPLKKDNCQRACVSKHK